MKLKFALTDTALRTVKPREKSYKLADGGGLYLLVNPHSSMLWRYKFTFNGKEKLLTLGQYPAVKLAAARKAHQDAKIKLQAGTDSVGGPPSRAGRTAGGGRGSRALWEDLWRGRRWMARNAQAA